MIQKKRLLEKINHLGSTEHVEILRIVNKHGVATTVNKNGVFFNMTTLPSATFNVIEEFVNYCYDNKLELDKYDQKLHECKYYNKNPSFATAYGVNEPKSRRGEAGSNTLTDAAVQRAERLESSGKMNEFVRKLCCGNDGISAKRGGGSFTAWKKKFMKRSVPEIEAMLDILEKDGEYTSISTMTSNQ